MKSLIKTANKTLENYQEGRKSPIVFPDFTEGPICDVTVFNSLTNCTTTVVITLRINRITDF